ncbi:MAG: NADH-quinone oxidoreductase subunit L [Ignavibacteriae bacterium]|nr:NADH-quinone oxidoreductase subunit L [Ignavibacteriota bacterium]MCB9216471.1 NADH-quinone oxidoreductase subunit L [Ignavibacteria bacterium]
MASTLLPFILLLPFAGFLVNGLLGKKIGSEKVIGAIGTAAIALPFLFAVLLFFEMLGLPPDDRAMHVTLASWITAGKFSVDFAYQIDQLSMIFLLIITGVGSLIHIYSIGYMHGDRGFFRFFAYLNLFIFMMLNLVLADNFLVTFLGWEGVGLCSFLLIGFWYDRKFEGTAITWTGDAAKKAFVMNRIGDLGMLIGMFILFSQFGTLKYAEIAAGLPGSMSEEMITIATLCLFLGACGKSAQIPLGVWLPDAMAGPTPVSALIHAATMVTAGIFLVARNAALFSMSHTTMAVIAGVAVTTALIAATVGLVQNDIKKVLAYSTVSQLGFMFVALGVGAWTAAVFHVMTHAFFKALLFLGSGSVIHGMHEEQDMQKMGGLKKYMPQTYKTYLIGSLAIAGIVPFSGFFSKDEILASAFANGNAILWGVGALAAFCTAFYMFRSVFLTFHGEERFDHHHVHPHESPATMTIPLWILAVLATVGGFLGLPIVLGEHVHALHSWLEPVFAQASANMHGHHLSHSLEWVLMGVSLTIAALGIFLAYRMYIQKPELPNQVAGSFKGLYKLLWNKWYVDEAYQGGVVKPIWEGSKSILLKGIDKGLIDGTLHGLAKMTGGASNLFRKIQSGVAQQYMLVFMVGILVIIGWLVFG